jgi:nicotinamidase-related amidase
MTNPPRIASLVAALLVCAATVHADPKKLAERFTPQNSAVLLVDHQKLTVDWLKSQPRASFVQNLRMLTRISVEGGLPLLITSTMEDQVAGPTIKDIQDLAPKQYAARIKRGGTLDAFADPAFKAAVKALGRKKLVIAGLMTDICLFHTVESALREGYQVWVVADASGSMNATADQLALGQMRDLGAIVTGANSLMSELFNDFGTPDGAKVMKINLEEIVSKLN